MKKELLGRIELNSGFDYYCAAFLLTARVYHQSSPYLRVGMRAVRLYLGQGRGPVLNYLKVERFSP